MVINLDGSEKIKIKDKGNGFKNVTISGVNFRYPDGNIGKGTIVIPECKFESDNEIAAFPDENKVLFKTEFESC